VRVLRYLLGRHPFWTEARMSIGVSVFLIALGAIFSFAITADSLFGFLDLDVLGYILMAAGAIGLVVTLYLRQRKRVRVLKNGKTVEETTTDV
jgi:hypothetical protein